MADLQNDYESVRNNAFGLKLKPKEEGSNSNGSSHRHKDVNDKVKEFIKGGTLFDHKVKNKKKKTRHSSLYWESEENDSTNRNNFDFENEDRDKNKDY